LEQQGLRAMPDEAALEYGAIRGLLQVYGYPYTIFIEPPQAEIQTNMLTGSYGGIGARLERDAQNKVLIYPYPNSPSALAGIKNADQLISVDQLIITSDTNLDEIIAALRGPIGDQISITVARYPGYTQFDDLEFVRAEIPLPSITFNLLPEDPSIGIIHLNIIAATTPSELEQAIHALQKDGAERFILDLRNNGGGLVEGGIATASLFATQGEILEQNYKNRTPEITILHSNGAFSDLNLVILVNQYTASAAELVAGILQALGRAELVGTSTYGKNLIQLVFGLSDGSSLHVTAAEWHIPGQDNFGNGTGLVPEIIVAAEATYSDYIQSAISVFNK